jgi:hypothetical protein
MEQGKALRGPLDACFGDRSAQSGGRDRSHAKMPPCVPRLAPAPPWQPLTSAENGLSPLESGTSFTNKWIEQMEFLSSEVLFNLSIRTGERISIGDATYGNRIIAPVTGGEFDGPILKGTVLSGGGDWLLVRKNGCRVLDVRIVLETHDNSLIYTTYSGRWMSTSDKQNEVFARETSHLVDPSHYYLRAVAQFEAGDERYAWMNDILAVCVGRRIEGGVQYTVYKIL